jgi:SAM-dependent methyltransferase
MSSRTNAELVAQYYDVCWNRRFVEGHNAKSRAIHYGLYEAPDDPPEEAKLNTNRCIERLAAIAPAIGPLRVLDAGCGVGGTAIDLARRHPNVSAVGLTLSAEQVELATRFAAEAGVADRVTFARRDYTDSRLPAGSFDVIWAVESLCHAPDRRAFFREAGRLLAPGGRVVVVDFFRTGAPLDDLARAAYEAICDGFMISDYYDEDLPALAASLGWVTGCTEQLSQAVLPGVDRSGAKARVALNDATATRTGLERAHLLTCTFLPGFLRSDLLAYRAHRFERRQPT